MLPAMALMRVVGELTFRLIWCYRLENPNEEVSHRIDRWYKYSLIERNKVSKKWLPFLKQCEPELARELKDSIDKATQAITSMKCRSAPPLMNCVEMLGKDAVEIFPLLYQRYSNAVHIDSELLDQLWSPTGLETIRSGDGVEVLTPNAMEYEVLMGTLTVISPIWGFFGWDLSQHQALVDKIANDLFAENQSDQLDTEVPRSSHNQVDTQETAGNSKYFEQRSPQDSGATNKLTDDIVQLLAQAIGNTAEGLLGSQHSLSPPKSLAIALLGPLHTYYHAVIVLAENKYELPALAILRTLGEFTIRLLWCYESTENGGDAAVRIERWYKHSLYERRNTMKKWLPLLRRSNPKLAEETEHLIEHGKEEISAIQHTGHLL
jgi:hypothetical protein